MTSTSLYWIRAQKCSRLNIWNAFSLLLSLLVQIILWMKLPRSSMSPRQPLLGTWGYYTISWLTHWGQDKMDTLSQTFSNAFSLIKLFEFQYKFKPKFVPKGAFNNNPALVQMMAWHQTGNILNQWWPRLLTHICITRPQWVKVTAGFVFWYLIFR